MGCACILVFQYEEMICLTRAVFTLDTAVRKMCILESEGMVLCAQFFLMHLLLLDRGPSLPLMSNGSFAFALSFNM